MAEHVTLSAASSQKQVQLAIVDISIQLILFFVKSIKGTDATQQQHCRGGVALE